MVITREYEYSFGDDLYIITERTKQSYPLCECLKNVIDSFKNRIYFHEEDYGTTLKEVIVLCSDHERRVELLSALEHFGKMK